jgi:hypothetical protein
MNDTNIEIRNGNHNHMPVPEELKIRRTRNEINRRASDELTPVSAIYSQEIALLANDNMASAAMPPYRSIQTAAFRHRAANFPPLPATRLAIQIPQEFQSTTAGEQFVLYEEPNKDFIIFCTPTSLDLLCDADVVYMDGTFDASPVLFQQLYTMHVFLDRRLIPVVYCLMSRKDRQMYYNIFNILKNKSQQRQKNFNPAQIMSDFESGLIPAVTTSFPQTLHKGCYFHFVQAIYRNVQRLGLVDVYTNNNGIRIQVR